MSTNLRPMTAAGDPQFLMGVDENGLGSLIGPMTVTAVTAEVSLGGAERLKRKLRGRFALDLGDSKSLVRFGKMALAEAWCRALLPEASSPNDLLRALAPKSLRRIRKRCPNAHARSQCLGVSEVFGAFEAPEELVERVQQHLKRWQRQGIRICHVESEVVCAEQLNRDQAAGGNRFISDLHAMERLILSAQKKANAPVDAVCGKVGGMQRYEPFLGPLKRSLTETVEQTPAISTYRFGALGQVRFAKDADSEMPLVMLASLIGKYQREVLMGTISGFYGSRLPETPPVSGYHDPKTRHFQLRTVDLRAELGIPSSCFER